MIWVILAIIGVLVFFLVRKIRKKRAADAWARRTLAPGAGIAPRKK